MVEKLFREDFLFGVTLFLFALGVLVVGLGSQSWGDGLYFLKYDLFATFLVSGVAAFFALIVSIKAVLK